MKELRSLISGVWAAALVLGGAAQAKADTAPPAAAKQAGYGTLTYAVERFDQGNVDMDATHTSGFKLYPFTFFSANPKRYSNAISDGVLVARGNSAAVASTACTNNRCNPWVGTAFGGGGYIEVEVAYDETKVQAASGLWPAVWLLPMESVALMPGYQWRGQPDGFHNSTEIDMLEQLDARNPRRFSATIHNWFGFYNKSCVGNHYCEVANSRKYDAPPMHDFKAFHKVAVLWVPATSTSKGSLRFFYDGQQLGAPVTWEKYDAVKAAPPITAAAPWAYGVLDQEHLALIIGSGDSEPVRVRSIHVWQASDKGNIRQ